MQIALISDIHGNLPAFEAVLKDINQRQIPQIICLGDLAVFGPQPREVIARLKQVNCPVVMGNTDEWLLDPKPYPIRDENSEKMTAVDLWCAQQLNEEDKAFVRTFRPFIEHPLPGSQSLLCYHGSPRSNTEIIRANTPEEQLEPMFAGHWATVMAGGHTHTPMLRRYKGVFLLNPGSIGLPLATDARSGEIYNPAWAEYAVIEATPEDLQITFHRVRYDIRPLVTAVQNSHMPHADWWLKDWRA